LGGVHFISYKFIFGSVTECRQGQKDARSRRITKSTDLANTLSRKGDGFRLLSVMRSRKTSAAYGLCT